MYLELLNEKIYYNYENDSKKPLVVYIHGLGGSAALGENYLKFKNRNYRLLCFDLVGRGKSSFNQNISMDFWIENIKEVLNSLNIKEFFILSHSLGCYLSSKILLDKQFSVSNCLYIAPFNPFIESDCQIRTKIASIYPSEITKTSAIETLVETYNKIDKEIAKQFLINGVDSYIKNRDVLLDFVSQRFYDNEVLETYKSISNFEIVAASDDKVVSIDSLNKLANIKGKKFISLDGGHDVIVTQTNKINELVNDMVSLKK